MLIIGNNKANDWMESSDILIDDKSGRKINIPVGMIGFSSANKLKEYLEA